MVFENAVIIRDKTRLEQLIERFNSKAQAKFYLEQSGSDFESIQQEHDQFYYSLKFVQQIITRKLKMKLLDRSFLPTYLFSDRDLIIVLGQDGLVANAAKYVDGLPILAVNPDEEKYDGVILPFGLKNFERGFYATLKSENAVTEITMAEAKLSDGQSLLAFNDFYIGASTHISSKYELSYNGKTENQSSSGIIVSTGAGSTGWLSSVMNMNHNVNQAIGNRGRQMRVKMDWSDQKLIFVVREPFQSKATGINIGFGEISQNRPLKIRSNMPQNGVIFSDGVLSDFLNFNSGTTVEIGIAHENARLVMN